MLGVKSSAAIVGELRPFLQAAWAAVQVYLDLDRRASTSGAQADGADAATSSLSPEELKRLKQKRRKVLSRSPNPLNTECCSWGDPRRHLSAARQCAHPTVPLHGNLLRLVILHFSRTLCRLAGFPKPSTEVAHRSFCSKTLLYCTGCF